MGSGFKDFAAGDVLTAADVDGYLMRQTVMTFADASARDTALSGVLDEGMMAYLEDSNVTTYYDGSAWIRQNGRVLQVVQNTSTSDVTTTSTSYVTGGLTATITPTLSTSKILILTTGATRATADGLRTLATIFRGDPAGAGVNLANPSTGEDGFVENVVVGGTSLTVSGPMIFLDSPATTSSTTYYYAIKSQSAFNTASLRGAQVEAVMVLVEIAA